MNTEGHPNIYEWRDLPNVPSWAMSWLIRKRRQARPPQARHAGTLKFRWANECVVRRLFVVQQCLTRFGLKLLFLNFMWFLGINLAVCLPTEGAHVQRL